jgi:hypothetical protein
VNRAVMATTEFIELAPSVVDAGSPIKLSASYDDFTLRILIQYAGQSLERPGKSAVPNAQDIEGGDEALRRFGVSLMTRMCDEIKIGQSGHDCSVHLSFR